VQAIEVVMDVVMQEVFHSYLVLAVPSMGVTIGAEGFAKISFLFIIGNQPILPHTRFTH
jgi:hypothetical protein